MAGHHSVTTKPINLVHAWWWNLGHNNITVSQAVALPISTCAQQFLNNGHMTISAQTCAFTFTAIGSWTCRYFLWPSFSVQSLAVSTGLWDGIYVDRHPQQSQCPPPNKRTKKFKKWAQLVNELTTMKKSNRCCRTERVWLMRLSQHVNVRCALALCNCYYVI